MNRSHIAALLAITASAATLTASPALACDIGYPYYLPELRLHPSGEVAAGALIWADQAEMNVELVLLDANGDSVAFETNRENPTIDTSGASIDRRYLSRTYVEPSTPLLPGTYTLTVSDDDKERLADRGDIESSNLTTTFTVLDALPSGGAPAPPVLSWRAAMYDGPEQPDIFSQDDYCGPYEDTSLQRHVIEAKATGSPDVFVTVTLEEDSGSRDLGVTGLPSSEVSLTRDVTFYEEDDFVSCVTAIATDVYGRTSEPTKLCAPDQCVAKNRNDRDPVDWSSQPDGCSDWSPGFAERNAPGCACAQSPAAPTPAPWLAALAVLGLVGLRRRKNTP